MRSRSLAAGGLALALATSLTACSGEDSEPEVIPSGGVEQVYDPAYDPEREPAAAVMSIVPDSATQLVVIDFDQLRLELGYGDLGRDSDPGELGRFWDEAATTSVLLDDAVLREPEAAAAVGPFRISAADVAWQARFSGPDGEGLVLGFHDDTPMGQVQEAVASGAGPLAGAVVVPSVRIAAVGATADPTASWAADPALVGLVGSAVGSVYVSRECVEESVADEDLEDLEDLDELDAFSVAFGRELVTVELGDRRNDAFARLDAATTLPDVDPAFDAAFLDPTVADPQGGRLGYRIGDVDDAARLVTERQLPFAVCGG